MDATLCNVVYVDRTIQQDRIFHARRENGAQQHQVDGFDSAPFVPWESQTLEANVSLLADVFGKVHLCSTGNQCIANLFDLQDQSMLDLKPTIVLIGTPHNDSLSLKDGSPPQSRSPSPHSPPEQDAAVAPNSPPADDVHGLRLLQRIVSEAHLRNLSKLVVPIPVVERAFDTFRPSAVGADDGHTQLQSAEAHQAMNRSLLRKCAELGATDVLLSPIQPQSLASLEVRAYRAHKSAARDQQALLEFRRGRKRSWVGITDDRPFAYLRETMVASLMRRICQMEEGDELPVDIVRTDDIAAHRRPIIAESIGSWYFSAHTFTEDELVHASLLMFKHALSMPQLAQWRIPTAIGHDVGHPGVNNGFLVVLNTPLAQLYNDRSVLESFHCAAYSQILRRYWPAAFDDTKMRSLMISSILSTDMGLHFDYIKRLVSVQDKLAENNSTDGWDGRMIEEQTALACALLIKCADISNVARRHDAAVQWMHILSDEFSRQAFMEDQLAIKSSLVSQPKKDNASLFRAQLGFMNMFAIPLFQGVSRVMPSLQYCVDELNVNKALFEKGIADKAVKQEAELQHGVQDTSSPPSPEVAVSEIPAETVQSRSGQPMSDRPASHSNGNPLASYGAYTLRTTDDNSNGNGLSNSHQSPLFGEAYKGTKDMTSRFDAVVDFAASNPFDINDARPFAPTKQRVSEATDGSTSVPSGGDCASQATSATTGKMPLSPSTQGTSIISRDSLDRSSGLPSAPAVTVIPDEPTKTYLDPPVTSQLSQEDGSSLSSGGHSNGAGNNKTMREGPLLKKKSSRFRMNAFTFLRRHLSPSPPLPTSNGDITTP
ncbi:3'5'-cyclic nucleotide phosphodiesterase, catalytic domain protein [Niveomyces insectorum RCEF 264]|uniref:Phosphodiesterase n=1 Tax=Niveomyces insectorum RCEF 264 TaxID=1081102 RepID=A0A167R9N9_9HYPO|nr:3'5'-cyclic nucleotide phosphodiesterase, catalytic domain protein [Niveomyces insectorum RCEF 264]